MVFLYFGIFLGHSSMLSISRSSFVAQKAFFALRSFSAAAADKFVEVEISYVS